MRRKQKLVWSSPAVAQAAASKVRTPYLGRYAPPAARPINHGEEPEVGSMWVTTCPTWIITGSWDGTELSETPDLGEGAVAYLSTSSYAPSHKATVQAVPKGTVCMYLGTQRVTEWDGKGWARPVRLTYLVNGVVAAPTGDVFRSA